MKVLVVVVTVLVVVALSACVTGAMLWVGWNVGVCALWPAAPQMSFGQAVAVGLLLTGIGAAMRLGKGGKK